MKKKHLVIICGVMYPNPSATGICAKRYAELLTNEYEIDIICIASDMNPITVEYNSKIRIHALAGGTMKIEAYSIGLKKRFYHFFGQLQIKTRLLGNLKWFSKASIEKLDEIHNKNKIDCVFSICSPFAAHIAAEKFKKEHPNIHWCGYTVDPYAVKNRIRPFLYSYTQLVCKERKTLLMMDSILVSEEVFQNRKDIIESIDKCEILPYVLPEFKVEEGTKRYFDENDINCIYAGSLYSDIRNPKTMLETFSKINNSNIKLHLFSRGCEEIVSEYAEKSKNIVLHQCVATDEIRRIYNEADFLVNIGNKASEFMPSKTFEYIATGKPIINFYYNCPETELEIYPKCLQIQNFGNSEKLKDVEMFILENKNKKINRNIILDIYKKHSKDNVSYILHEAMY